MYLEEIVERKREEYSEEMLITLELEEARRAEEQESISELTNTYASLSHHSIFGDLESGYDY